MDPVIVNQYIELIERAYAAWAAALLHAGNPLHVGAEREAATKAAEDARAAYVASCRAIETATARQIRVTPTGSWAETMPREDADRRLRYLRDSENSAARSPRVQSLGGDRRVVLYEAPVPVRFVTPQRRAQVRARFEVGLPVRG